MQALKVGTDLEFAVFDPNLETYVPAGILPIVGRKGYPQPLTYGGVEIDCCAVEITPPPATTEQEFADNILNLLNEVKEKYSSVKLVTRASHMFDEKLLQQHPEATTMGCDPDFNAWNGKINPRPKPPKSLRSFGGHVHIEGGTPETIRACDLTLGMWSVMMDRDENRRKLYGKAGAFRYKPYGVEYRVMSNFWCDDEENIKHVFRLVNYVRTFDTVKIRKLVKQFGGPRNIQNIINNSVIEDAKNIYEAALLK